MNNRVARGLLVTLAVAACALAAHEARAQAYKYKDSSGHVHFTEDYDQIPERYRKQVETREMPAHVDPNSPEANKAQQGATAATFEEGVRQGMGGNLTVKQEQALHAWIGKWMWPFIAGLVVNWIITLSMVIHAFVQGRIGWGLANFFIGVTTPVYVMLQLEQTALVRVGLLFLWIAPMIVGGMAGSDLASALH
ncbi:MAG TPA: DUF4124 domain-containing protein [Myxococcota bacterium]|nr:DUF4124 domain-containing protein [Myxococcota bacterium]